jgi:hypothetical protein
MDLTALRTPWRYRVRVGSRALSGLALAAILGLSVGLRPVAAAESNTEVAGILPAFNRICSELQTGREALGRGNLTEEAFVDLVLDLFVRADSLSLRLQPYVPAGHAYTPVMALARGLTCLKDSLRENYEGLVARDGARFITADLELTAALAWRSGVTDVASAAR